MNTTDTTIRNLLQKPTRLPVSSTTATMEPEVESEYSAFAQGRVSRLPQLMLSFRLADGSVRAFAYSYLYGVVADDPNRDFTLDFSQHRVKVSGRNLEALLRLISQHRVAEIREAERTRSFELAPDAPLVEQIEVRGAER